MRKFFRFFPFLVIIILIACAPPGSSAQLNPATITAFSIQQTIQAASPTPTPTKIPDRVAVVNLLNKSISSDELREVIDAKFSVLDVTFEQDQMTKALVWMRIRVECECVFGSCCSTERAFVELMRAINNKETIKKIQDDIPTTIDQLVVDYSDHMILKGTLLVPWKDVKDYVRGDITGGQLGILVTRR
jgi:hypothetical protein